MDVQPRLSTSRIRAIYAWQSTKILTCLFFSSISGVNPSSTTRSILIFDVIIVSGLSRPSPSALMTSV